MPEGLNYVTYYEKDEVRVSDTLPTEPGTYSFIVEVEGNDQYNSVRLWRWFRLVAPVAEKVDPEITFSYENGTTFTKGADVKPGFTVSEGAVYTTHYYCEAKDATFATYEELEAGYAYSLVVTVTESDKYNAKSAFAWFRLEAPTTKVDPEVTISIENGATLTVGGEGPTVTVPEGLNYVTYYEKDEVRVSDTLPTEPGTYSFICDLHHSSKEAIQLLYKNKPKDKLILITDSMEAKFLLAGEYSLGGQKVFVKDGTARLIDNTLAGSILHMNDAIRNLKDVCKLSLEEAIDKATINPAKNLRIDKNKGSISLGKDADFVIIDRNLNVYRTYVNGKEVYRKK